MDHLTHSADWLWSLAAVTIAAIVGLALHSLAFAIFSRLARRTHSQVDDSLVTHAKRPLRVIFPVLAILLVLPYAPLPAIFLDPMHHAVGLGLIAAIAWLAVAMISVAEDLLSAHNAVDVADNLAARRIRTQVQVLRQIIVFVIVIVALAVMLMTFPSIRHLGESLFASAGLAALLAGLAARSTFSNLLAGVQIAFTQPMRLDDVVIVEGEWGWIEEITTTYVVVRIWDLRRLIVPLSYFIEKPFQNWTRKTADLLGTVFLYTDYTIPVEEVRQEFHRVLESSNLWDGKVWGLQVTNTSEHTMELRALMSAPDASRAFNLRCHVREKMIGFLQEKYPESLPKTRAVLARDKGDSQPAA
jgi:small-conductance mechanosensitive channel